jgi:hypothetical protein
VKESPVAEVRNMIRIFDKLKEELKKTYKNNSMDPKRTQIKISRKYRNNKMNSKRISTN